MERNGTAHASHLNGKMRIGSLTQLDALIGEHVTAEEPITRWEDSHSLFSFETEEEAVEAIRNPYYQMFLPDVDWTTTVVHKVNCYSPYSSDLTAAWRVVERLSVGLRILQIKHEQGRWLATFDGKTIAAARTAPVAICLAALNTRGIEIYADLDALS